MKKVSLTRGEISFLQSTSHLQEKDELANKLQDILSIMKNECHVEFVEFLKPAEKKFNTWELQIFKTWKVKIVTPKEVIPYNYGLILTGENELNIIKTDPDSNILSTIKMRPTEIKFELIDHDHDSLIFRLSEIRGQ